MVHGVDVNLPIELVIEIVENLLVFQVRLRPAEDEDKGRGTFTLSHTFTL